MFLFFFKAFQVSLQYLFNIFILLNTVTYIKLKMDPKMYTFKNLKKLKKTSGDPVLNFWWYKCFYLSYDKHFKNV